MNAYGKTLLALGEGGKVLDDDLTARTRGVIGRLQSFGLVRVNLRSGQVGYELSNRGRFVYRMFKGD